MKKKYYINFGQEDIQITDEERNEVIYWHKEEWIRDPEIVFSIANAIQLAMEGELYKIID